MKIIEAKQENIIECNCGYKIKNESGIVNDKLEEYINRACPECGKNLCTIKEYIDAKALELTIKRVNKCFGWLGYFYKKEKLN